MFSDLKFRIFGKLPYSSENSKTLCICHLIRNAQIYKLKSRMPRSKIFTIPPLKARVTKGQRIHEFINP
jgi:hypothetical protein